MGSTRSHGASGDVASWHAVAPTNTIVTQNPYFMFLKPRTRESGHNTVVGLEQGVLQRLFGPRRAGHERAYDVVLFGGRQRSLEPRLREGGAHIGEGDARRVALFAQMREH